jgi:hypothetical protein
MDIQFRTAEQARIADLLWACQSQQEVNVVLRAFGLQAYIVKEMIIAASFDDVVDVAEAQQALQPYRLTGH